VLVAGVVIARFVVLGCRGVVSCCFGVVLGCFLVRFVSHGVFSFRVRCFASDRSVEDGSTAVLQLVTIDARIHQDFIGRLISIR
jgi:hypothetical protein